MREISSGWQIQALSPLLLTRVLDQTKSIYLHQQYDDKEIIELAYPISVIVRESSRPYLHLHLNEYSSRLINSND